MITKIEVFHKSHIKDPKENELKKGIIDLGIKNINDVSSSRLYEIEGDFSIKDIRFICKDLLIDVVVQDFRVLPYDKKSDAAWRIEVWFKSGVTDSVGDTVKKGICDLGITNAIESVKTGEEYILKGDLTKKEVEKIATSLLANTVVQQYTIARS